MHFLCLYLLDKKHYLCYYVANNGGEEEKCQNFIADYGSCGGTGS